MLWLSTNPTRASSTKPSRWPTSMLSTRSVTFISNTPSNFKTKSDTSKHKQSSSRQARHNKPSVCIKTSETSTPPLLLQVNTNLKPGMLSSSTRLRVSFKAISESTARQKLLISLPVNQNLPSRCILRSITHKRRWEWQGSMLRIWLKKSWEENQRSPTNLLSKNCNRPRLGTILVITQKLLRGICRSQLTTSRIHSYLNRYGEEQFS